MIKAAQNHQAVVCTGATCACSTQRTPRSLAEEHNTAPCCQQQHGSPMRWWHWLDPRNWWRLGSAMDSTAPPTPENTAETMQLPTPATEGAQSASTPHAAPPAAAPRGTASQRYLVDTRKISGTRRVRGARKDTTQVPYWVVCSLRAQLPQGSMDGWRLYRGYAQAAPKPGVNRTNRNMQRYAQRRGRNAIRSAKVLPTMHFGWTNAMRHPPRRQTPGGWDNQPWSELAGHIHDGEGELR
jgi:hypothetical protein